MRWILFFSLLCQALFHGFAQTQQASIELSQVEASYQFGSTLTIQAQFSSPTELQDASLDIQSASGGPETYPLTISTAEALSTQIDLANLNLQPFSRIYYWFEFSFSDGSKFTSPSYWLDYVDNRFTWQSNQSKWFAIYWANGDTTFGAKLQEIALAGLKNATQILPVSPDLPITIYVYPDAQSAQAILSSTEPAWVAGEALPQLNMIIVSAATDLSSAQDLERQIPHEITHLLEYKLTQQNYSASPAWLLEGLASNAETSPNPDYAREIQKALADHNLIPMSQLCHAFSPDTNTATLAYAQSGSFVNYLTSQYGSDKVMGLLENSGNGLDCSQLVNSVLGKNLETLDSDWQSSIQAQSTDQNGALKYWPYFVIGIVLLTVLVLFSRFYLIKKAKKNGSK